MGQGDDPSKQIFLVLVTRWAQDPCPWEAPAGVALGRRTEPACLLSQEFYPCSKCETCAWGRSQPSASLEVSQGHASGGQMMWLNRMPATVQSTLPRISRLGPVSEPLRLSSSSEGILPSQTARRGPCRVPGMPRELCLPTALQGPTPRTGHTTNLGEGGEINH